MNIPDKKIMIVSVKYTIFETYELPQWLSEKNIGEIEKALSKGEYKPINRHVGDLQLNNI